MPHIPNILAAGPGMEISDLLYLLILLILPALNAVTEWWRKHAEKKRQAAAGEPTKDGDKEYEVVVKGDEVVVVPAGKAQRKRRHTEPQPVRTPQPMRPAAPTVRPISTSPPPVVPSPPTRPMAPTMRPAQQARPIARPQPPRPQPPRPRHGRRQTEQRYAADYTVEYVADYTADYRAKYEADYDAEAKKQLADRIAAAAEAAARRPARCRAVVLGGSIDKAALRRAIVLNEILSPPVALRGSSMAPFDL